MLEAGEWGEQQKQQKQQQQQQQERGWLCGKIGAVRARGLILLS